MKYNKKKEFSYSALLTWLPVAAALILLPILTSYQICNSMIGHLPWSSGSSQTADISLYCKQQFFILLSVYFLFLCLWQAGKIKKIHNDEFRKQWHMLIPLLGWLLLSLVSSLCSSYRTAAFYGSDEQYESFFCLAGYVLFALTLLLTIRQERDIKRILLLLAVSGGILGCIGVLQYTGNDPFLWEWVQRLMTPEGYLEAAGPITRVFEEGRVSLASYNPNYAGVLLTLLSTFCFNLLLTERNLKYRITELMLLMLLLVSLVGTGSKAGLLVFAVMAVFSLLLQAKNLLRHWKIVLPVAMVVVLGGILALRFSSIPVIENLRVALTLEKTEKNPLQELYTDSKGIHFTYHDTDCNLSYSVSDEGYYSVSAIDEVGNEIEMTVSLENLVFRFTEMPLSDITVHPVRVAEDTYGIILKMLGVDWAFVSLDNTYYYINKYGRPEQLTPVEHLGFEGYETFASARGLIWSTTLPLLKNHLLLGAGANNFVFEYPQNDYANMYYYTGSVQSVNRPHCMYLQTAVEAGVPALLCLLVFFGWYLVQSLIICFRAGTSTFSSRVSFACFTAVAAYLVCGLTNDSMISVAPVFWGILGLGLAVNRITLKELSTERLQR